MDNPTDEKGGDDDGLSTANDFVQIYVIQIDIYGAHNLEKADTFGKSDPYCKISALSTSYTTCTIRKSLNPKWNEHVEMTFFDDPKTILFEVFDYDGKLGGKDDDIGNCKFNLTDDIYNDLNKGYNGKIKLENCKSGEIEIKIIARKLLPLELEKRLTILQNTQEQNTNTINTQNTQIIDANNKNKTLQNDINTVENNINVLNEQIPITQNEQKQQKEIGNKLVEENKQICIDINSIEQEYNELEKKEKNIIQQLEGISVEINNKNKECENVRNEINNLTKQIENKKKKQKIQKEKVEKKVEPKVEKKENVETVSDGNKQSVVYSDKFMEKDYEDPNYGLLKNQVEVEQVSDPNANKCCVVL